MLRSIVPERIRAMGKIFKEYGGTIITVVAVVLLISFVTTSMNTGGVLYNAFGSMINSLSEKPNDMVNGAAGGSGNSGGAEEAGWPVSWNTMDVMDNPKVDMGEGMYLVKVSDFTPTAAELADTKITVTMDGSSESLPCLQVIELAEGAVGAMYDEEGTFIVFSVATTEEVEGLQFPEPGLWAIDYGSLGMDADVMVDAWYPEPGLYETGSNYTVLLRTWDNLLADDTIQVENGVVYTNLDLSSFTNSSADALAGDLALPNDGSVTALGDAYFDASVDELRGRLAFMLCSQLTSVKIPNSVTSIGSAAFAYCTNLTSITIPNSVTDLGDQAFYCSGIASISLPDGITNVGAETFYNCSNLGAVSIPNGVTSIGEDAFFGCLSLESVTIPDGVTNIGHGTFSCCENITSITIPDSVTNIGSGAFAYCDNLLNITLSNNVTNIGERAFYKCYSLSSITIPDSVTSIGTYAFEYCTSLTSVTFGENSHLFSIGDWAFSGCANLGSITIPDSVTNIGSAAFSGCTNLMSVVFENAHGWWYASFPTATSGTDLASTDLADAATAATYLTSTYINAYWFRSEG